LKAILQPVVENCMKHAQPKLDQPLQISIEVWSKESEGLSYIEMVIRDNGQGFSADKLTWINEQLEQIRMSPLHHTSSNIGLLNIHFRLNMYYHQHRLAGITIKNLKHQSGAEVIIRMPKLQDIQEVHAHVISSNYC